MAANPAERGIVMVTAGIAQETVFTGFSWNGEPSPINGPGPDCTIEQAISSGLVCDGAVLVVDRNITSLKEIGLVHVGRNCAEPSNGAIDPAELEPNQRVAFLFGDPWRGVGVFVGLCTDEANFADFAVFELKCGARIGIEVGYVQIERVMED